MRHVWICFLLAGCMVGPDYKRPDAPAPVAFKELAGWKISQPADTVDKGTWWSVYHDRELDRLERMVEVSNQTVKQFEAQYQQCRRPGGRGACRFVSRGCSKSWCDTKRQWRHQRPNFVSVLGFLDWRQRAQRHAILDQRNG